MITFIEHVPSGKTWTTDRPLAKMVDTKLETNSAKCLHFYDENGRMISLPPKIFKQCIFEVYPDHKGN